MEGVTVSIRGDGKPFVTTVFTNQQGVYLFPPVEQGKYKLWAQAQTFQTAKLDVDVASGQTQQVATLELKPLKDFENQLSGIEWMNSFPENTPQEKREKQIFASNCSGCHNNQMPLQNRFDASGWGKILSVMSLSSEGTVPRPGATGSPTINAYREEIVGFLTKVRGPSAPSYPLKPLPRPTGEATQVVITEFDLPNPAAPPESYMHNGSDWMEGSPSRWEGRASHDVALGQDGNIYFSDDRVIDRTIGKLDPRTGKVTSFKLPDKDGVAVATHGLFPSPDGTLWMNGGEEGFFLQFDPKTEKFKNYPKPDSLPNVGGTIAVDSKGIPWATSEGPHPMDHGSITLDVKSGKYTNYPLVTRNYNTYGITTDREDNPWVTSPGTDRVDTVDTKTGKVYEVVFEPLTESTGLEITAKDRDNYTKLSSGQNTATPLHNCPRRIEADHSGDLVWVALFCSDKIASIDIHTRKVVKEYTLPHKWSRPYALIVDQNHMVWIDMLNTDMVARLDPKTEKVTEFQMPTRGTNIRHLTLDKSTDPPIVWAPYDAVNKIARIQFRKSSEMQ